MNSLVNLYIVVGSTGEYSDHYEYPIAVYTDEEEAKKHVVKADEAIRLLETETGDRYIWPEDIDTNHLIFDVDPSFSRLDSNHYRYEKIPMVDKLEQFIFMSKMTKNDNEGCDSG